MSGELPLELLRDAAAAAAGVAPAEVEVRRTHASTVLCAGARAYKLKRPVDLGFLDFRTLQARQADCREEVRLNRRLAPDVYLGTAEVRQAADGRLRFWLREGAGSGAEEAEAENAAAAAAPAAAAAQAETAAADTAASPAGTLVDCAVVMRRLPEARMLGTLLEAGPLGPEVERDLELLIERLVQFHRESRAAGTADLAAATPEACWGAFERNLARLERFVGAAGGGGAGAGGGGGGGGGGGAGGGGAGAGGRAVLTEATFALLRRRGEMLLREVAPCLRERAARGAVVEAHGDLHSRNICMVPGAPVAYDCLEFSRAMRSRDVSAELAFLAMDLDLHGESALAERLVRRYAALAGDPDLERPQRYFRLHYAVVRTMVEALRADEASLPELERLAARRTARRHAALAAGYALPPSLVLTCGLPGSGKSTLAAALAVPLRALHLRSDVIRKEQAGLAPEVRGGAALYAQEATERTYAELRRRAFERWRPGAGVGGGGGGGEGKGCGDGGGWGDGPGVVGHVIADAAFLRRAQRQAFLAGMAGAAAAAAAERPWVVAELAVPSEELRRRLDARRANPAEPSDADAAVLEALRPGWQPPEEIPAAHLVACPPELDDAVERCLDALARQALATLPPPR